MNLSSIFKGRFGDLFRIDKATGDITCGTVNGVDLANLPTPSTEASGLSISAIPGIPDATNVQEALEWIALTALRSRPRQYTITMYPSVLTNKAGTGTSWTAGAGSLANAQDHLQADDDKFAVCQINTSTGDPYSKGLLATGLIDVRTGLPPVVPSNAAYLGCEIFIKKKAVNTSANIIDQVVSLTLAGEQALTAMNLPASGTWPETEEWYTYGAPQECWNVLGIEGGLTFHDLIDPTFGALIQCGVETEGVATAMIEQLIFELTYEVPV